VIKRRKMKWAGHIARFVKNLYCLRKFNWD
jgi:hypothetical protein